MRSASLVVALLLLLAAASPASARRARCARGTVPVLKGTGAKAKMVLRKGKVRCARPKPPRKRGFPRPSAKPQTQFAATIGQLDQALLVDPAAFSRISARIGARRTRALLDRAAREWRARATGARAAARARAAADGIHEHQTFAPDGGIGGSVTLDATPSKGSSLGIDATGSVEITATPEALKGIKDVSPVKIGAGSSAKLLIELALLDAPAACPSAAGKVKARLKGKAKATLTIVEPDGRSESQSASAELDMTYALTVGEDAHWETIDDVDAQAAFAFGRSGGGTETWRARRLGGGFARKGLFDAADFTKALEAQAGHFDTTHGGIFGPHTSVKWSTGPTAWDIQSISNLKGMLYTGVASDYLVHAALEYVRKIAAARVEKHWYDDEACLRIEGKPAATRLKAGQTTKVTTRNAKASDGTPVKTNLAASGTASLKPGTASMPAGGAHDFTLTAPNETPAHSTWKVVATSRAGKKTVEGSLGDEPVYEVRLTDDESSSTALYSAAGRASALVRLKPVAQSNPASWTEQSHVFWNDVSATATAIPGGTCTMIDPVDNGDWTVTITQAGADELTVVLDFSAETRVLWTIHCVIPQDNAPPSITDTPGQLGLNVLALQPLTFKVPATGGSVALGGSITDPQGNFTSSAIVTVTLTG